MFVDLILIVDFGFIFADSKKYMKSTAILFVFSIARSTAIHFAHSNAKSIAILFVSIANNPDK